MKNKLNVNTFRKIPLKKFIDTLIKVYDSGVDFIDIVGKNNPTNKKDIINIRVKPEYKTDDIVEYNQVEEEEIEEETKDITKPFSDKNISDII